MQEVNVFVVDMIKSMHKVLILLFFWSVVYGEDNKQPAPIRPHHIYFGPEAFAFNLNTHIKNINIYGLNLFEGLRLRYEYLQPKAIYAGLDLFSAVSTQNFKAKLDNFSFPSNNHLTGFSNFELRLGYTPSIHKKYSLTPFLGFGGYYFGDYGDYFHFREIMLYIAAGMRCFFEVNPLFTYGLNWKIFRTFDHEQKFIYKSNCNITLNNHDNAYGGELGVPFIWRLGTAKRWDVQLEPYFLKLNFSERENIYGLRLLFGYPF